MVASSFDRVVTGVGAPPLVLHDPLAVDLLQSENCQCNQRRKINKIELKKCQSMNDCSFSEFMGTFVLDLVPIMFGQSRS